MLKQLYNKNKELELQKPKTSDPDQNTTNGGMIGVDQFKQKED